jgi:hypothetical protein
VKVIASERMVLTELRKYRLALRDALRSALEAKKATPQHGSRADNPEAAHLDVATRNVGDFDGPGLALIDPWTA